MKRKILFSLFTTVTLTSFAQSGSTNMGARAQGVANAAIAISDEWALRNNPAGLAQLKNTNIAFALNRVPALLGANKIAMVATSTISAGTIALGAYRFGDNLYNEHIVSIGYGHQLGLASLGARLDYIQYRVEGMATVSACGVSFGGIATIGPQVSIGASVSNLNRPRLPNGEHLPVTMTAGVLFRAGQLVLVTEVLKQVEFDPTLKAGAEYQIHKKFYARTGFNVFPNAAFMGFGLKSWKLKIDYALQYTWVTTQSHQLSVCYIISRKDKESR